MGTPAVVLRSTLRQRGVGVTRVWPGLVRMGKQASGGANGGPQRLSLREGMRRPFPSPVAQIGSGSVRANMEALLVLLLWLRLQRLLVLVVVVGLGRMKLKEGRRQG